MVNTTLNIAKLEKLLEQIEPLRQSNGFSIEFKKWNHDASNTLRYIYGESSHYFKEFIGISFSTYRAIGSIDIKRRRANYSSGLDDAQILLQSIVEEIKAHNEGDEIAVPDKRIEDVTFSEDETASGVKRARQNVIHEAGLFQDKLGFKKAVLLRQEGTEDFSNVAGLQYISFTGNKLEQTFWELQEVLKREGQLP